MKKVLIGAVAALAGLTSSVSAQYTVNVRGTDYPLVSLLDSCVTANGGSEAQLKCFVALTALVKEQTGSAPVDMSVGQALEALQTAAQFQDAESGLRIGGTDCNIQILYYNNYYFMSRRNVSAIDVFSASFDAGQLQLEQTVRTQGGAAPVSKGMMQLGATAEFSGGVGLESAENNFPSKAASESVSQYAMNVADQLPGKQDSAFDFVLVHPKKADQAGDIWKAFENFVYACKG